MVIVTFCGSVKLRKGRWNLRDKSVILSIVLIFIILAGCSVGDVTPQQKNTIEQADLTQKESTLLQAAGVEHQLVFDVNPDDSIHFIRFYVDHYINGVKKEETANVGVHLQESDKNAKFERVAYIISDTSTGENEYGRNYSISYMTDNGVTTGSQQKSFNHIPSTSTSSIINKTAIKMNEPMTLAYLIEVDGEMLNVPDEDFLTLKEDQVEEVAAEYDHLYLFRVEFHAEVPKEYQ